MHGSERANTFIEGYNRGENTIRMQGLCNMKAAEVNRHYRELVTRGYTEIDGKTIDVCDECKRAKFRGFLCNWCEPQCRWCGKSFKDTTADKHAVFCSKQCHDKYLNASDEVKNDRKMRFKHSWKVVDNAMGEANEDAETDTEQ